jgi:1,4-dihydroxy-2-naphthoate octaprenyltransferase
MKRIKKIIEITRAPFFTAVIVPTLLGTAIAWYGGFFRWDLFLLTLVGITCVNAGLDMSNDYFDHTVGTDDTNQTKTPFSGGSRAIQQGVVTARQVLIASLACYAVGIIIGLYLAISRGWPVLLLGLIGVFLAFFHNAPPVRIYSLAPGLGELAVGIGCGPLVVMGTYYVQAQRITTEVVLASLPVGLLIAAVLYINEFPDVEADAQAGRKTVPVVIGRARAVTGYIALLIATYVIVVIGSAAGILPVMSLVALLTLPLAYRAVRDAYRYHSDTPKLVPVMATTIQVHLLTGLLLCTAYIITGIVL